MCVSRGDIFDARVGLQRNAGNDARRHGKMGACIFSDKRVSDKHHVSLSGTGLDEIAAYRGQK